MLLRLLYLVSRFVITAYTRVMLKMNVRWHEDLPKGPFLIAANHPSTTDAIFVHALSSELMSVMIHTKIFTIPVLGAYMRRMKQIPVIPGKGEQVIEEAAKRLKDGNPVVIFPEGHVTGHDAPRRVRLGVARLAMQSGVPVIPMGIYFPEKGCKRVSAMIDGKPDLITWYLRGPYAVTIGKPLRFHGDVNDFDATKSVAEKIMDQIRLLTQESRRRVIA